MSVLKTIRAPVLVGALVLSTIAGGVYMVTKVQTTQFTGPETYVVNAVFEDVTGLVRNSSVTMVGIPVGIIDDIKRVSTDEGVRAQVVVRLSTDVKLYSGEMRDGQLVGAATVIRKQSSLLGDYYLSLTPGLFGTQLVEGDDIPVVIGKSGVDALFDRMNELSELTPRLEKILDNVEKISDGLALAIGGEEQGNILAETVRNVKDISQEVKEVAGSLKEMSGEVRRIVDEGTIGNIATNLEQTTADAREIADRVNQIVSAGDVQDLVKNLSETSAQLSNIGVQLSTVVDKDIQPRLKQLTRIFGNFERFSKTVADFADEQGKNASNIMANVTTLTEKLLALTDSTEEDIKGTVTSVQGAVGTAQNALKRMDKTLDNLQVITADMREGKGTIGRLLTDDRLIEEVEEVISDTKDFVKSYSLMQTEVQLASSYYIQQESVKNVFSIKFRPKVDKYYLLQIVDDPRGSTASEYIITETNDPTGPAGGVLKERIERTTHSLKLSFLFAKRWHFLTGRFGIIESTGGLGIDFTFFKDRLNFQFDLFDFTMDQNPRLRAAIEWEIMKHFFLAGGADDLLNDRFRDYYFSAGIRFTDKDLKALLIASPPLN